MTKTNNYGLNVVEGTDVVNLLTQMNPNTTKIDEVMKANENSGIQNATELYSNNIHAITRSKKDASMFKFTAVSNFTAGDTFTVDGIQVTALLTSGEPLGTGAYIIGSEILCSLKGTLLTIFTQSGKNPIASDSERLGGKLPEYYATAEKLAEVKSTADNASSLSRANSNDINTLTEKTGSIKEVLNEVVNVTKNVLLEANSAYMFISWQDVGGTVNSPTVMMLCTGSSSIKQITLNGNYTDLWSVLPTSGLTQGLYPKEGFYNRSIMMKL